MFFTCCSLSPGGAEDALDSLWMSSQWQPSLYCQNQVITQLLTRDLCVKSINIPVLRWGKGFHLMTNWWVLEIQFISLLWNNHTLQQVNLNWIVLTVHHSSSVPLLPQELFNHLEMSSDPVTHKLVSFAAISLAIKKDVFLCTWIKKAAWGSVIGGLLVVTKREQKIAAPKKQKTKQIYKRLLYTQLFNQKVRGGDSGSSGRSSASWDPEWSEHL